MTAPQTEAVQPDPTPPAESAPDASQLVEVSFKGNRREFFLWPQGGGPLPLRTPVIVEADRGEDLGLVHATGELAERRKAGTAHGHSSPPQLHAILRLATPDEAARAPKLRADEDEVRRRAIEKVRAQHLDMKVSDTEWQWDRKKLTIYFTAEKRVDFRNLVRQLEGMFSTRVQMWHIGVRDEAKRLDGIGRCGRQFCSAGWLPELRPVKSSVAKDQRLSTLNPAQISGSCGRLMCCLRYEHEFYVQQRKRFPKEGKSVTTTVGEEKIVANDIFREQVTLRSVAGEIRIVALAALMAELGGTLLPAPAEHDDTDDADHDEETLVEIERAPTRREHRPATAPVRRPQQQQQQPAPRPPAQPATPAPTAPTAESAQPAEDDDAPRRKRRRRGRRGGRRGRDGASPDSAPDDPSPPPGT